MQRIVIGLTQPEAGWVQILEQEGVAFTVIRNLERIRPQGFSVIIVNHPLNGKESGCLKRYLSEGGAVLSTLFAFKTSNLFDLVPSKIRYILPDNHQLFDQVDPIEISSTGWISPRAQIGLVKKGQHAILMDRYGSGYYILLPFDVHRAIVDLRATRKHFFASKNLPRPSERVAKVTKGEIRKLVTNALRLLHLLRSIPYIHLWYHPYRYQTSFAFRLDVDQTTRKQLQELLELARSNNLIFEWFINIKENLNLIDYIQYLYRKGQNIGLHGYEHRVYKDFEKNMENLSSSYKILLGSGIKPVGFTAPYGEWNEELGLSLDALKIPYSSEFTVDYDNLPYYPASDNRVFNHLQIPIHPICIGRLLRAGYKKDQILDYFKILIRKNMMAGIPIFIYHHPAHNNIETIARLMALIDKEHSIMKTCLTDFYRWWKKRLKVNYTAVFSDGVISMNWHQVSDDQYIRIIYNNREAYTPFRKRIYLKKLQWHKLTVQSLPSPIPGQISPVQRLREDISDWLIRRIRR